MNELRVYKAMPEWNAQTLPPGFRKKHNTKEGTWAQLTVLAGALRFTFLDEDGTEQASHVFDVGSGPQLLEPGVWHKVEPIDEALRCQLSFLCEPDRYMEKKHQLTAPHSEVQSLLSELEACERKAVLDLGCGRGRNSFFLAERGFSVTAVDRSDTAIEKLRAIQQSEDLSFPSHVYDINDATLAELLPEGSVDHVVSTVVFQFLDATRVSAIIADMQAVTRPGGLHLIVAPTTSADVPCPIDFPFVFETDELRKRYSDWEVVRYQESMGEFHKRDASGNRFKARFATLVARKPG